MNDASGLEPARIDAIRAMLTDTVAGSATRRPARTRLVVAFSLAATAALVVGGVAFATNGFTAPGGTRNGSNNETGPVAVGPTASAAPSQPSSNTNTTQPPEDLTPAAPATATQIPTTKTANPLDPTTWNIDYGTLGPLKLGTPVRSQLLAAGFTDFETQGCVTVYRWQSFDSSDPNATGYQMQVELDQSGDAIDLEVFVDGKTSTFTLPGSPATAAGIGLGVTLDAVKAAYPNLATYSSLRDGGYYYSGPVGGNFLTFGVTVNSDGTTDVDDISATAAAPGSQLCQ